MDSLDRFSDDYFYMIHLSKNIDLSGFVCKQGFGLENYLKNYALDDEEAKVARTYLIISKDTQQIVSYFSLRSGLITVSRGLFKGFDTYTAIELANFANNDLYSMPKENIPKLGAYVFYQFILPLVNEISDYVGAAYLYIFALPYNRLISHYNTMGFSKGERKASRFVYRHVKPVYDRGCIFMYQKL